MDGYAGLPRKAFTKADPSPDTQFYQQARLVTHIDDTAIAAVTRLYRELIPIGGHVLDLMASWVSHLPEDVEYSEVIGHGMNAEELSANPRFRRSFVQDLNVQSTLPLVDSAFDAVLVCVSVQYLQRPIEVFAEVARVLRPSAPVIVTFSNRCFPTKAVAIWRTLDGASQAQLVDLYLRRAGFDQVETRPVLDGTQSDPLWAVIGRTAS